MWFQRRHAERDRIDALELHGAEMSDDEALRVLAYGEDADKMPRQFWSGPANQAEVNPLWKMVRFLARRVVDLERRVREMEET